MAERLAKLAGPKSVGVLCRSEFHRDPSGAVRVEFWLLAFLLGWLLRCLVGWLLGWLVGCLVGWLLGSLVAWLVGCLVCWLVARLVGWCSAFFGRSGAPIFPFLAFFVEHPGPSAIGEFPSAGVLASRKVSGALLPVGFPGREFLLRGL